ncbi:YadA C-terminal domain-containing protein [Yersinia pseudotuberculosis]
MALGNYRDGTAIAAGGSFQVKKNVVSKTAVSWDAEGGVGVSAGVSVGW